MQRTLYLDLFLHLHGWLFVGVIRTGGGGGRLGRFSVVILSLLFDFETGLGVGFRFCFLAVGS